MPSSHNKATWANTALIWNFLKYSIVLWKDLCFIWKKNRLNATPLCISTNPSAAVTLLCYIQLESYPGPCYSNSTHTVVWLGVWACIAMHSDVTQEFSFLFRKFILIQVYQLQFVPLEYMEILNMEWHFSTTFLRRISHSHPLVILVFYALFSQLICAFPHERYLWQGTFIL